MNIDDGCIGLKRQNGKASSWCGKIREPGSMFCPHHKLFYEDSLKEQERRRQRTQQRRDERKAAEEYLRTTPLAATNPNFVDPAGRNRRARPSPSLDGRPISQPSATFQLDPDPLAESWQK